MDIKKTGHTCETSPEACAQPYLLPDTTLALFWMGRGAAILSSAQMTAEDLVFAVRGLGEAQAAYLQKLIEVCGACDALCECRAARVEETDALRRLPPKLLRELWEKGVCIRNLGRALASGAFLYDARNIRKRGTYKENGTQKTCEVTSFVYVVYGYEEPNTASAPPVHIESYSLTVDGEPVSQLFAGDEAVLSMTIRNNDQNVNARKVRIGASIDTKVLLFTMGETDTKYVDVIESGKSADISYKITVANEAAEGPTNFSVTLNYENWEVTQASASQTLPLSVKQPVRVEVGEPTIYDSDAKPEEPIAMSLSIVNKGRSKIYNVSIDVEGKGLSMYEDYYGGDVLPAAKLNPDILVSSTTAGKCSGNLLVHYEDSEGEAYTETVPVSFTVAEQPVVQQPEQNDQIESEPIEQPKKKVSTGAVIGGAAGVLALGGAGLGIALKKRRGKYEVS